MKLQTRLALSCLLISIIVSHAYAQRNSVEIYPRWTGDRNARRGECNARLRVDGEAIFTMRGDRVRLETLSGGPPRDEGTECTGPLPRGGGLSGFRWSKGSGRGKQELLEEPSDRNDWTTRVRIRDDKGGEASYTFRFEWENRGGFDNGGIGGGGGRDPERFAIRKCQEEVEQRIRRSEGGRGSSVTFDGNPNVNQVSNAETGVRGTGVYRRDRNDRGQNFSYDAVLNIRNGQVTRADYRMRGGNNDNQSSSGGPEGIAIERVQQAVLQRVKDDRRGLAYFIRQPEVRQVSNAETGVRGVMTIRRDLNDVNGREVRYEGTLNIRTGQVVNVRYDW